MFDKSGGGSLRTNVGERLDVPEFASPWSKRERLGDNDGHRDDSGGEYWDTTGYGGSIGG